MSKRVWKADAVSELRQTKKGFGEPKVDRFSISPSVGRAYLACPHATEGKPLFIYQVHVENPVPTTDTADYGTTHEHLITEAVLANEGGRIPVSLVGQVLLEPGERVYLVMVYRNWKLEMTHEEEDSVLWIVQDGVWRYSRLSREEAAAKLAELRSKRPG